MNEKTIKQLTKLSEAMAGGAVQPDELAEVVKVILSVIKELKTQLETQISTGDKNSAQMCDSMMFVVNDMEKKMIDIGSSKHSMSEMNKTLKGVMASVNEIRQSMPTMPDLNPLKAELSQIKASMPVVKDIMPEVNRKLDDLYDELKKYIDDKPKTEIQTRPFIGGRVGIQVLDGTSKVGTKVHEISFGSGLAVSIVNGLMTISTTGGGTGYTKEIPVGSVDGVNTTYTVTTEPVYVIADGATYFDGAGYTYSALSIVMTNAPSQYIRNFY